VCFDEADLMLNPSLVKGPLIQIKSQAENLLHLAWDLILILLTELWRKMSLIERKSFLWRAVMSALLINCVYLWASLLFYYGSLPVWINDGIANWIIQPFRNTLSLNGINWAVNLGNGPGIPIMTTPLISIASWDHYVAVLASVCVALAFLTEPRLWRKVRTYVKHIFENSGFKQWKLDSFFQTRIP